MQRSTAVMFVLFALCAFAGEATARLLLAPAPAPTVKVKPLINFKGGKQAGCSGGVSVTTSNNQPLEGAHIRFQIGNAILEGTTSKTGNCLRLGPQTLSAAGTSCTVTILEVRPAGKTGTAIALPATATTASTKVMI